MLTLATVPDRSLARRLALPLAALALVLAACKDAPASTPSDPPSGPVVYPLVSARLRGPSAGTPVGASGGETAAASGEMLSFEPDASTVFGAVKAVAGMVQSYRQKAQINQMTQQIAALQASVAQIQQELALADNTFYQYVQSQAALNTDNWMYFYDHSLAGISGTNGAFQYYLGQLGIASTGGVWPPGTTYQSVATSATIMGNLKVMAQSQVVPYMGLLQDLSAASVPYGCTDCYKAVKPVTYSGALTPGGNTSATVEVYEALFQQLQAYMPQNGGAATNDFPPLIEQYNDTIMAIYQQNLAALQEAYTIEATSNYLNYVAGQSTAQPVQIPPIENSTSLAYAYGGGSVAAEQAALTSAQEQLALLYAARINVLATTTVQYIVSDPPFSNFAWPVAPTFTNSATSQFTAQQLSDINAYVAAHPYSAFLKKAVPTSSLRGPIAQVIPSVTVNPSLLYQYDGLNAYYQCGNAIFQTGTTPSATTCPPLFPNVTDATWNGFEFSVYYDLAGTPALALGVGVAQASSNLGPFSLYVGTSAAGAPQAALYPVTPNPAVFAGGAQGPVSSLDTHGNVYVSYGFGVTNLLPADQKNPVVQQNGPYQQTIIYPGDAVSILNQFTTANGYVGLLYINMAGHMYPDGAALGCTFEDFFCWAYGDGICMGNNLIQMSCESGENATCSVSVFGTCP